MSFRPDFNEKDSICLDDVNGATCTQGNTCRNGAACVDSLPNSHICICTPQWTGDLCDYPAGIVILTVNKVFKNYFKVVLQMRVQSIRATMGEYALWHPMVVSLAHAHQTMQELFVKR